MCFLCDSFGDPKYGNGLWYLKPGNYARNLYKLRAPGQGLKGPEAGLETGARSGPEVPELINALETGDYEECTRIQQEIIATRQGSQVVILEDADKVLELCSPIGLIACVCRKSCRAIDERNEFEYTCMGVGVGMLKWERWPERYKGGVKFLNIDEAKEWNHEMDKRGFVHVLMLFNAPYIGGFCQCDYPDCRAIREAVDFGVGTLKGHHVASVDYEKCNGCGICVQRCKFGALKFEVTSKKTNIDLLKCFGCGLCQTGCPRGAITMLERKSLPTVAEVWR